MNGWLRLWIVVSLFWVICYGWIYSHEFENLTEPNRLQSELESKTADGDIPLSITYKLDNNDVTYEFEFTEDEDMRKEVAENAAAYFREHEKYDKDRYWQIEILAGLDTLSSFQRIDILKEAIPEAKEKRLTTIKNLSIGFLGLPLVLLFTGFAAGWVYRGFNSQ